MAIADDYDFLCGNDFSLIKAAFNNDEYHTLRMKADLAITINLLGGIRNIDEIIFNRCYKLTRIFWPNYAGSIKRLKIGNCHELAKLDLHELINLEELCIINCPQLIEIAGLREQIKFINIQGCHLKKLDLSLSKNIKTFILTTTSPHLQLNLGHCNILDTVAITLEKPDDIISTPNRNNNENEKINLDFNHCLSLATVKVTTHLPTSVDVTACASLEKGIFNLGEDSEIIGSSSCLKLNMEVSPEDKKEIEKFISYNKQHALKMPKNPYDTETVVQEKGILKGKNKACLVKMNILKGPRENHFSYTYDKYSLLFREYLIDPNQSANTSFIFKGFYETTLSTELPKLSKPNPSLLFSTQSKNKASYNDINNYHSSIKNNTIHWKQRYYWAKFNNTFKYFYLINWIIFNKKLKAWNDYTFTLNKTNKYIPYNTAKHFYDFYKKFANLNEHLKTIKCHIKKSFFSIKLTSSNPEEKPFIPLRNIKKTVSDSSFKPDITHYLLNIFKIKIFNNPIINVPPQIIAAPTPLIHQSKLNVFYPVNIRVSASAFKAKQSPPSQTIAAPAVVIQQSKFNVFYPINIRTSINAFTTKQLMPPKLIAVLPELIQESKPHVLHPIGIRTSVAKQALPPQTIATPPELIQQSEPQVLRPIEIDASDSTPVAKQVLPPETIAAPPELIQQSEPQALHPIEIDASDSTPVAKQALPPQTIAAPPELIQQSEPQALHPIEIDASDSTPVAKQTLPPETIAAPRELIQQSEPQALRPIDIDTSDSTPVTKQSLPPETIATPPELIQQSEPQALRPIDIDTSDSTPIAKQTLPSQTIAAPPELIQQSEPQALRPIDIDASDSTPVAKQTLPPQTIAAPPELMQESEPQALRPIDIDASGSTPVAKQVLPPETIAAPPELIQQSEPQALRPIDIDASDSTPVAKQVLPPETIAAPPELIQEEEINELDKFSIKYIHSNNLFNKLKYLKNKKSRTFYPLHLSIRSKTIHSKPKNEVAPNLKAEFLFTRQNLNEIFNKALVPQNINKTCYLMPLSIRSNTIISDPNNKAAPNLKAEAFFAFENLNEIFNKALAPQNINKTCYLMPLSIRSNTIISDPNNKAAPNLKAEGFFAFENLNEIFNKALASQNINKTCYLMPLSIRSNTITSDPNNKAAPNLKAEGFFAFENLNEIFNKALVPQNINKTCYLMPLSIRSNTIISDPNNKAAPNLKAEGFFAFENLNEIFNKALVPQNINKTCYLMPLSIRSNTIISDPNNKAAPNLKAEAFFAFENLNEIFNKALVPQDINKTCYLMPLSIRSKIIISDPNNKAAPNLKAVGFFAFENLNEIFNKALVPTKLDKTLYLMPLSIRSKIIISDPNNKAAPNLKAEAFFAFENLNEIFNKALVPTKLDKTLYLMPLSIRSKIIISDPNNKAAPNLKAEAFFAFENLNEIFNKALASQDINKTCYLMPLSIRSNTIISDPNNKAAPNLKAEGFFAFENLNEIFNKALASQNINKTCYLMPLSIRSNTITSDPNNKAAPNLKAEGFFAFENLNEIFNKALASQNINKTCYLMPLSIRSNTIISDPNNKAAPNLKAVGFFAFENLNEIFNKALVPQNINKTCYLMPLSIRSNTITSDPNNKAAPNLKAEAFFAFENLNEIFNKALASQDINKTCYLMPLSIRSNTITSDPNNKAAPNLKAEGFFAFENLNEIFNKALASQNINKTCYLMPLSIRSNTITSDPNNKAAPNLKAEAFFAFQNLNEIFNKALVPTKLDKTLYLMPLSIRSNTITSDPNNKAAPNLKAEAFFAFENLNEIFNKALASQDINKTCYLMPLSIRSNTIISDPNNKAAPNLKAEGFFAFENLNEIFNKALASQNINKTCYLMPLSIRSNTITSDPNNKAAPNLKAEAFFAFQNLNEIFNKALASQDINKTCYLMPLSIRSKIIISDPNNKAAPNLKAVGFFAFENLNEIFNKALVPQNINKTCYLMPLSIRSNTITSDPNNKAAPNLKAEGFFAFENLNEIFNKALASQNINKTCYLMPLSIRSNTITSDLNNKAAPNLKAVGFFAFENLNEIFNKALVPQNINKTCYLMPLSIRSNTITSDPNNKAAPNLKAEAFFAFENLNEGFNKALAPTNLDKTLYLMPLSIRSKIITSDPKHKTPPNLKAEAFFAFENLNEGFNKALVPTNLDKTLYLMPLSIRSKIIISDPKHKAAPNLKAEAFFVFENLNEIFNKALVPQNINKTCYLMPLSIRSNTITSDPNNKAAPNLKAVGFFAFENLNEIFNKALVPQNINKTCYLMPLSIRSNTITSDPNNKAAPNLKAEGFFAFENLNEIFNKALVPQNINKTCYLMPLSIRSNTITSDLNNKAAPNLKAVGFFAFENLNEGFNKALAPTNLDKTLYLMPLSIRSKIITSDPKHKTPPNLKAEAFFAFENLNEGFNKALVPTNLDKTLYLMPLSIRSKIIISDPKHKAAPNLKAEAFFVFENLNEGFNKALAPTNLDKTLYLMPLSIRSKIITSDPKNKTAPNLKAEAFFVFENLNEGFNKALASQNINKTCYLMPLSIRSKPIHSNPKNKVAPNLKEACLLTTKNLNTLFTPPQKKNKKAVESYSLTEKQRRY